MPEPSPAAAGVTAIVDHPTAAAEDVATVMPAASPAVADVHGGIGTIRPRGRGGVHCGGRPHGCRPPAESLPPVGAGVGELAPSYSLTLFDGSTVSSEDLAKAGKPVFLFFTATW